MVHTGLEKSLKNGTVLENSLNFKISAFVLEKYCLEFCQKLLEIFANILEFLLETKACCVLTIYPAFRIFLSFTNNAKLN